MKENLFTNTVQKIRQARASNNQKKTKMETSPSNKRRKSCPASPGATLTVDKPQDIERRPSSSSSLMTHDSNLNIIKEDPTPATETCQVDLEGNFNLAETAKSEKVTEEKKEVGACKVEEVKTIEQKDEDKKEDEKCGESLKKDDPYSSASLRKRSSVAAAGSDCTKENADSRKDPTDNNSYIDVNSNVNYTKLLNDQIMDIDQKVVNFCKSKTDLSGK